MKPRTEQDAIDQILHTARQARVAWVLEFLEQWETKTAADIAREVDFALSTRNLPGRDADAMLRPEQVAVYGGDHEDCAAFAIALAIGLALPYQLSADKGVLYLVIDGVTVLPRKVT